MSATGAGTYFAIEREDVAGVQNSPSTLTKQNRLDGDGIVYEVTNIEDGSIRSDGNALHGRHGNFTSTKSLQQNIRYGEADEALQGVLRNDYVTTLNEVGLSVDVDATAKTITRSTGDFTTDVNIGDFISIKGASNNGLYQVTNVIALVVTVQDKQDKLVDSTGESVTAKIEYIENGMDVITYTFEEGYTDATTPFYIKSLGNRFGSMDLGASVDNLVNVTFNAVGRTFENSGSASGNTYVSESTKSTMVTFDEGYAQINSDSGCLISDFSMNVENGLSPLNSICTRGAFDITAGRCLITGSLTLYVSDGTNVSRMLNETEFPVYLKFTDTANNAYAINMPSAKFTSESRSLPENEVTQSLDFEATLGAGETGSIRWYRHTGE